MHDGSNASTLTMMIDYDNDMIVNMSMLQQHAHCAWTTTIIQLFLLLIVRVWYVCVAIIHWTLTWTTGSLSCALMLMHAIAHGCVQTPKKSLYWKLTLGRKSVAAPGNQTWVRGVTVRCANQLSYSPFPLTWALPVSATCTDLDLISRSQWHQSS